MSETTATSTRTEEEFVREQVSARNYRSDRWGFLVIGLLAGATIVSAAIEIVGIALGF